MFWSSAWEGKREGFLLASFYAALCSTAVHRKRNSSSLSSLCPCPFFTEKNQGHQGTQWDCFLWYGALPVPKAHSSSASDSVTPRSAVGRCSETSSKHREASLCLSQEKGSSGSACPRLLGAGPPASTQRTHPSRHLLLPATGLTTQTLQWKEQNTRFFFFFFLLSWSYFFAAFQLYAPGSPDFYNLFILFLAQLTCPKHSAPAICRQERAFRECTEPFRPSSQV